MPPPSQSRNLPLSGAEGVELGHYVAAPFSPDGTVPHEMVRWTGPAAEAHNDFVVRELLGEEEEGA